MAGVGKLLKQAQKMQRKMEALQEKMAEEQIEVSSGGGAVKVQMTLAQEIRKIELDEEFLKEDKDFVEETILEAVRSAISQTKKLNEEKMQEITSGMSFPGLM